MMVCYFCVHILNFAVFPDVDVDVESDFVKSLLKLFSRLKPFEELTWNGSVKSAHYQSDCPYCCSARPCKKGCPFLCIVL